ncbi:TrkA C-terminal domain-containing protein [Methanohalobium sp.]|uniref:TrkA C-terminal domain-containing protein n=1 Tax=Methanohalobium sp. TaxID=2837493 RepID=UPI0025E416E9|nr:TrkA C-terminal domain-containing protein [Methanohalobium sp.]
MEGFFYFPFTTLLVIFISFLIVRASSIALMMTGLDQKRSRFQALSAFTGTGFTTKEAELIVNNPRRRRIIIWLMILGNAGIVTVIVTMTSTVVVSEGFQIPINIVILLLGLVVVYKIATHTGFLQRWDVFIENRLLKTTNFEEEVTEGLLHLLEGYGLIRVIVKEDSFLLGISLNDLKLSEKNLLVIGIERNGEWISVPKSDEIIKENDRLVVYGPLNALKSTFEQ